MNTCNNSILIEAADQTKAALLSTEGHVDLAIAGVAATILRLGSDRERAGLSVFHTQKALEDAVKLTSKMIDTRGDLTRFHTRMAATARRLGLEQVAIGPTQKPSDGDMMPMMSSPDEKATKEIPELA